MKIDVLGVQAFVAVADHKSFRRAAGELSITQTALSRRLQNLESFLGVRLVERSTRSVALTPPGESFLPQARRLLTDLAAALTEIRETGKARRGDVTIACVPTIGVHYLPQILQRYSADHPQNRVKVLDHSSAAVAQAVLTREAEFGINIAESHPPSLESVPLLQDDFVLICRDDHPLAGHEALPWKALEGHRLIFPGASSNNRPLLDHALAESQLELSAFYEVQRSSTAVGLVAAGAGIAVAPRLAWQAGSYPGLRVVTLHMPTVRRTFSLLSRKGAVLSPAAQALHDLILKHGRQAPAKSRRGGKGG
ncbi:LysR family transcriptional regulator [Achromobacter sp. Marseille-Q0513]|uniref:LysR family transcriptional regulator n=1 Tax=Achromobacter sp. Marseille-Q0513 TaxID=2829161 RepID=UPI001B95105C|nr:LysR family transcriptional regulator [Achromobacter sp. Marseille-Q0513]MBR8657328.1 LysR family transcriptional regulator [Achromobacter sp. Marseille-Q0513]